MPMPQIAHPTPATTIAVIPLAPRIPARGKGRRASQIVAMQDVLYSTATNPNAEPRDRAQAAQAYAKLEVERRKIQGIADPGVMRPDSPKVRAKTRSTLARTLSLSPAPEPAK